MSATGSEGILGFGAQAAKGTVPVDFYKHRAMQIDLSWEDPVSLGPLEVGGIAVPTFPYKTGSMGAGGFSLMPRLEDSFGWLLYGAFGACSSAVGVVDNYDHTFTLGTVPFMGFRKHIPRVNDGVATDVGEVFTDGKLISSAFSFPNMQPISARIDVLTIKGELDHDPTAWTYANADFEDWQSIPVSCVAGGSLLVDGNAMQVVQASVGFINTPLAIQQERIAFDPYMDDITIVERRMVMDLVVKWENPDLHAIVRTGSASGTTWSAAPWVAPFILTVLSSVNMPSSTPEPCSLIISAPDVSFNQVGGVTLAGGQAVMLRFRGVALAPTSAEYATAVLRNMVTSYTWPT